LLAVKAVLAVIVGVLASIDIGVWIETSGAATVYGPPGSQFTRISYAGNIHRRR